jgi:Virulence factor
MSKTDSAGRSLSLEQVRNAGGESKMPDVVVVYWRDIPAQVIVGKSRSAAKVKLTERFEQAIDRCAMKVGARDADAYLAEWRKAAPYDVPGDQTDVAAAEAARIEVEFDAARLKTLIDANGWADAPKGT